MRLIPVSEFIAQVDDEDYDLLCQSNWHAFRSSLTVYAHRNTRAGSKEPHSMHRLVMGVGVGDPVLIDHIDRNGLNNQKANLRLASSTQQSANRSKVLAGKHGPVTSRYKGVHRSPRPPRGRAWKVAIHVNGRTKHLGYFATEEDAARAYDAAAREAWGEFAGLNFP